MWSLYGGQIFARLPFYNCLGLGFHDCSLLDFPGFHGSPGWVATRSIPSGGSHASRKQILRASAGRVKWTVVEIYDYTCRAPFQGPPNDSCGCGCVSQRAGSIRYDILSRYTILYCTILYYITHKMTPWSCHSLFQSSKRPLRSRQPSS